ncbi:MAG: imidazole glycerol phosphate synthase subunit HisH [Bacteroidetes bacterium]|nr:imidazole glycerol phosphate synthase subunit HisH [Bacteroidota bacterium]
MIGIINYGSGNIQAVANIYKRVGLSHKIVNTKNDFDEVEKLILPGVGAFDATMKVLNNSGLRDALDYHVLEKQKPVLGICVGMQIMSNGSEEGYEAGLGWIKGKVKKFDISKLQQKPFLPHMGWNTIYQISNSALFQSIDNDLGFYFVHSFYYETEKQESILAQTHYGELFTSAINDRHIYGVQFHPEKSHINGIALLTNFAEIQC